MAKSFFPQSPELDAFEKEAADLLAAARAGNADAADRISKANGSKSANPDIADARKAVATEHDFPSWHRMVQSCCVVQAIHKDDKETLRNLIQESPNLLHEDARYVDSNWGPPMSYAANLGRIEIIRMLAEMGAKDFQKAFDRACLQGQLDTARELLEFGATPQRGCVVGPCETLNAPGLKFLLDLGAEFCDENGSSVYPLALILLTYTRNPPGKHACLDLVEQAGIQLPDTPMMAFHRGQLDKLAEHIANDPTLLNRRFALNEIYPAELECSAEYGLHGTPLDGTTLLHLCIDFDEVDTARWLIDNGADVNAAASVDADGFGGHTPLFNAVVSQAFLNRRQQDNELTRLLLDHGADPNVRTTLRKQLRFAADETMHEFHDVSPVEYGEQFHAQNFVNHGAVALIAERSKI